MKTVIPSTVTPIRSKGFDLFALAAGSLIALPLMVAIVGVVKFAL